MKNLLLFIFTLFVIKVNGQWVQQISGTANILSCIASPSANICYITEDNGYILKTINGGSTWNVIGVPAGGSGLPPIYFTSVDTGYYCAYLGNGILKTIDGGANWIDNFPYNNFIANAFHFPTVNIGYALGTNLIGDTLLIYKTINAGGSWSLTYSVESFLPPGSIYFSNALTGYMTLTNELYKTTDGGVTWNLKLTTMLSLNSVTFPSSSIGYAVGDSLFKSIDGGQTWQGQNNINPGPYYSVCFTDVNHGYAVGGNGFNSGIIIKTVDGGVNWTLSLSIANTFNYVKLPNVNTGYACGTNGAIYKLSTSIGIDDVSAELNNLSIYPNPATDMLQVASSKFQVEGIKIYDVLGEEVLHFAQNDKTAKVDVSGLASGLYFVEAHLSPALSTGERGKAVRKKFVKE